MITSFDQSIHFRKQFMINPEIIFLNHGSFGSTPIPVFQDYLMWQHRLEMQPVEFLGRQASSLLRNSRSSLSNYLHTSIDELVYVTNATTGINIIAHSLGLGEGDEVLTTDHEYGAMDKVWRFLSLKNKFKYVTANLQLPFTTTEKFLDDFSKFITRKTRAIFMSHITSPTAIIFPVKDICKLARENGILTIIDGAHAPGQMDLNLNDIGADFYSGNLHKWLCAPKGAGFLFARKELQNRIEPLIISWGWDSVPGRQSNFIEEQEWTGTRDISAFLSVPAAIRFQQENNWENVRIKCHQLTRETQLEIAAMTGFEPFHPDSTDWYGQMGASRLPDSLDVDCLKENLCVEHKIEIPVIKWGGMNLIRYSFQAYNSENDKKALLAALMANIK